MLTPERLLDIWNEPWKATTEEVREALDAYAERDRLKAELALERAERERNR